MVISAFEENNHDEAVRGGFHFITLNDSYEAYDVRLDFGSERSIAEEPLFASHDVLV